MNASENRIGSGELVMGDFVRLTRQNRMPRYQAGDRGMITQGPNTLGSMQLYYLVMMERDDPPRLVLFIEDEIERDSQPDVVLRSDTQEKAYAER